MGNTCCANSNSETQKALTIDLAQIPEAMAVPLETPRYRPSHIFGFLEIPQSHYLA
jgi:hypothetical protein